MQSLMRTIALVLALVGFGTEPIQAQANPPPPPSPAPPAGSAPPQSGKYSSNEVVDAGHRFFGTISRGLAQSSRKRAANGAFPTDISLARRPAARLSRGCVTGRESCTPRM